MQFVHIIYSNSIHTRNVVDLILGNCNYHEHCFITSSEELRDAYPNHNIIYHDSIDISDVLKEYRSENTAFILHSMIIPTYKLLLINKKQLKKIVWVVWGHDLYVVEEDGLIGSIKTCLKRMRRSIKFIKLKHLCAIGIGYQYDALQIRSLSSSVPILNMLYYQQRKMREEHVENRIGNNKPLRIMLGHSAFRFLNHKENLLRLSRYKYENIVISLVLSYGSKEYADEVVRYAKELFDEEKIEVIREILPLNEYYDYIQSIDVAIFDYKHQSALGNIFLLMSLGKKIYLHPKGILYQGAILDGWKAYSTNDIGKIDFCELSSPCDGLSIQRMIEVSNYYYNKEIAIHNWNASLQEIERMVNNV